MRHTLAIAAREFQSIFATPLGWILLGLHLVFSGYLFFATLQDFVQRLQQIEAMQALQYLEFMNLNDFVIAASFGTYQLVFIMLIPALTMRAFAEERANGTIELLLTSPVSATELVLGKYLGVLAVVALMVALSALFPLLLFLYGNPEPWQTLASLLAVFLVGAAIAALGCFTSTLTRSPAVAAVVAIISGLMLVVAGVAADLVPAGTFQELIRYVGLNDHFSELLRGLIRTQDLVYFAVFVVFFLALARTGVEAMRVR